MDFIFYGIQFGISVLIFLALFVLMRFILAKVKGSSIRFLNPTEYLPEEEVKTLKQVYYLALILLLCFSILNFFFDNDIILSNSPKFYVFNSLVDIIVSVYIAVKVYEKPSWNSTLLIFFLIPVSSIAFLLFGESLLEYWDFIRIPAFLYLIRYFCIKFNQYTNRHGVGFSILLLFSIIFFSVFFTIFTENVDPLDAIVMVSNAFTSNGYAILGTSPGGKVNSILLVWSGYIISGAATATLTAAILMRHFRHELKRYDEKLDEMKSLIEELKD